MPGSDPTAPYPDRPRGNRYHVVIAATEYFDSLQQIVPPAVFRAFFHEAVVVHHLDRLVRLHRIGQAGEYRGAYLDDESGFGLLLIDDGYYEALRVPGCLVTFEYDPVLGGSRRLTLHMIHALPAFIADEDDTGPV